MAKKLSKNLANRTKLRPDQLDRVKGGYGQGVAAKYDETGQQRLGLTRALFKGAKSAKRYVLESRRLGRKVYVADSGLIALSQDELPLTFEISQALKFIEGFDNPELKKAYYNDYFQAGAEIKFNWYTKKI